MLVYLDSSHFSLLERLPDRDLAEFRSVWIKSGCELALTLHHLQEFGQISDPANLQRRLNVLDLFPLIRCLPASSDLVIRLEIQFDLLRLIGLSPVVGPSSLDTLFPLTNRVDLRAIVVQNQPVINQMRGAHETGAEAANLGKAARAAGPRSLMRKPVASDVFDSEEVRAVIDSLVQGLPPEAHQMFMEMFKGVRSAIEEHGTPRRALENIYHMSEVEPLAMIPDEDLALCSTYYSIAREEGTSFGQRLELPASSVEALVRELNPYESPGFSLYLAVERGRRNHPKSDEPGDQLDAAHVMFAPYVDLLLADKRTVGFLLQEARDRPQLLATASLDNIARAGAIQHVAELIRQRADGLTNG